MPFPPPKLPEGPLVSAYQPDERALIAGYLLHQRAGTLKALESYGSIPADTTELLAERGYDYYLRAESYSRFLLYWIGYPVQRNQMYVPPPG